jgi:hypothetical protein
MPLAVFSGVVVVSSDDPGMHIHIIGHNYQQTLMLLSTPHGNNLGSKTLSAANAETDDYQVLYKVPAATAAACFVAACGSTVLEYRLRIGLYTYGLPNYEPLIYIKYNLN